MATGADIHYQSVAKDDAVGQCNLHLTRSIHQNTFLCSLLKKQGWGKKKKKHLNSSTDPKNFKAPD